MGRQFCGAPKLSDEVADFRREGYGKKHKTYSSHNVQRQANWEPSGVGVSEHRVVGIDPQAEQGQDGTKDE
jgi:hypothetical protein